MTYPEHEKLSKVKDVSQSIGEFLDWILHTKQYWLAAATYRNIGKQSKSIGGN